MKLQGSSRSPIIITLLIILGVTIFLTITPIASQYRKEGWHYHIQNALSYHPSGTFISLSHEVPRNVSSVILELTLHSNEKKQIIIDSTLGTIKQFVKISYQEIKHVVLKSTQEISFNSQARLLQTSPVNNTFLLKAISFYSVLIPVFRNLIVLAGIINKIDIILPLVLFSQSFSLLCFWYQPAHLMTSFFYAIHTCPYDIFSFLRIYIAPMLFSSSLSSSSYLNQYLFSNNLNVNIFGELSFAALILILWILFRIGGSLCRIEKLRAQSSKMHSIWNGYIMAVSPRLLIFTTYNFRFYLDGISNSIYDVCVAVLVMVMYLFTLIGLIRQIRSINSGSTKSMELLKGEIGLATRIDCSLKFSFDCLRYSIMYYPLMNFIKMFLHYIPVAALYDFDYACFGGPIAGTMLSLMIMVSSTGFKLLRDKIIYPLCELLTFLNQLFFIAVLLCESVLHSEISLNFEDTIFAFFTCIVILCLTSIFLDQQPWKKTVNKEIQETKELKKVIKATTARTMYPTKTGNEGKPGYNELIEKSDEAFEKSDDKKLKGKLRFNKQNDVKFI